MATKKEVALFGAKAELPASAANDVGMGNENMSADDVAIPQIKLLQALSPECISVEGAKPGKFYNTQTGELLDEIYFISLKFKVTFNIWKDQDLGGGKQGEFDTEAAAQAARAALPGNESDYDIQKTATHWILLLDPATNKLIGPAVIYMDRSKLPTHKDLNGLVARNSPNNESRLVCAYKFVAKSITNKAGKTFFVINVENATGDVSAPAYVSDEVYTVARDSLKGLSMITGDAANDADAAAA